VNASRRGRREEGERIRVIGFVIVIYQFVNHTGGPSFLNSLGEAIGDVEVLGG
jgi:hypothetical protein